MKRLLESVILSCLLLTGTAWGVEEKQLLDLTADNVFTRLDRASKETEFMFDASGAEVGCDVVCTGKEEVATDSQFLASWDKDTKKVRDMTFLIQVAYENDKTKIAEGMVRAAQVVQVTARLVNPKVDLDTLKKMQKRIGIVAEGLVQGEKKEMTYQGVKFSAYFMMGVYWLSLSPA